MSSVLELKKQTLDLNRVAASKFSQTMVKNTMIVPDNKPDIGRVMELSGNMNVTDVQIQNDKVHIQGILSVYIVYAPDGESKTTAAGISYSQEFGHTVDMPKIAPDMDVSVDSDISSLDYSLINSRKINARCTIDLSVKVSERASMEIATDAADNSTIQIKKKRIRVCSSVPCERGDIIVREQFELPAGKPSAKELLLTDVIPENVKATATNGFVNISGQLKICALYNPEGENAAPGFVEHIAQFNEQLAAQNAVDDMECEYDCKVGNVYCEVRENADGENRVVGVEILLNPNLKLNQITEISAIEDAYSTAGELSIKKQPFNIEHLLDNVTAQISHTATAGHNPASPGISQILNASATASIDNIEARDGRLVAKGTVKSHIIYLTDSPNVPIASMNSTSTFEHPLDIKNIDSNTACDAKVFVNHTGYIITGVNDVELRFVIGINVKAVSTSNIELVTELELQNESAPKDCASYIIYFVQEGDTLWDIAKRYGATVKNIMKENDMRDDKLSIGDKIKICV